MTNPTMYDQLTETERGLVASMLGFCDAGNNPGFYVNLREIPALKGDNLVMGDFALAYLKHLTSIYERIAASR